MTDNRGPGKVHLVGTGPGAPDLLTVRAARLLREADVALYDNLVSQEILALLPETVRKIHVGKRRSRHTLPQDDINHLMIELAREGAHVLRLKGGDPFVFGRGGEEAEALAAAGIAFEVVPGITAAVGVAASARIPLTHRGLAQSCTFVTGNLQDGTMNLDWPLLARARQTVAVYMGLMGLPVLCAKLIEHGRSPDTPAAIVQQGTTPQERTVVGTLATLPAMAEAAGLRAPTLILIGEVVALRDALSPGAGGHADAVS